MAAANAIMPPQLCYCYLNISNHSCQPLQQAQQFSSSMIATTAAELSWLLLQLLL